VYSEGTQLDCSHDLVAKEYHTIGGVFECYDFNYEPPPTDHSTHHVNIYNATGIGYENAVLTTWLLPVAPADLLYRTGIQVTFSELEIGEQELEEAIYDEINFAPPGQESFYQIQEVRTVFKDEHENFINETIRYDQTSSFLEISNPGDLHATHVQISVSFAFKELAYQEIEYIPEYKLENFFGDFAGILGLLTGLDTIKVMTSVPVFIEAIQHKTIFHLREHFL